MAKKKEDKKSSVVLERVYNVPLRKEFAKAPRWNRAKKAVKALKEFLAKHMKSEDIKIGKYLNEELWKHGIKNPPHHVKVEVKKDSNGTVTAELVGAPKEETKKEARKKAKPKKAEKAETQEEKIEEKEELIKEEQQEKAKEIEKEEIKELQREHPKAHAPKSIIKPKAADLHPVTTPMKGR